MNMTKQFRDPELIKRLAEKIHAQAPHQGNVKICHVCGTHEWSITHFGLRALLPPTVEVIAGPGCPVCIVPASEIDQAIELAKKGVVISCFGDLIRVPGSHMSLLDAKALGADVRVVYSISDAVKMAAEEQNREFVFFAVGFETTAPSTAVEVARQPKRNISFLVSHRVIPPAMKALVEMKDLCLSGFIAPGHVSTIIGLDPYETFPKDFGMPVVVAGFEPVDILAAVYMILKQLREGKPALENEYARAVTRTGNVKAQETMNRVFTIGNGEWRGLGVIPSSKVFLGHTYSQYDTQAKYQLKSLPSSDVKPGCKCHLVVVGKIRPTECPLFMKSCTPQNPVGACMVSVEGTCRIWAHENAGAVSLK